MSGIKFTPGPWVVEECNGSRNLGIRVSGKVVSGFTAFVDTRWPHADQCAEQEANAHLIAAAPDLYAALVEAKAQLENYELTESGETYNSPMINAALRKARGEP